MYQTFFDRLNVAVQNCRVGGNSQRMSRAMNIQPALRADLLMKQFFSHPFRKHFRTAARHGTHAGFFELAKYFFDGKFKFLMKEINFHGCKSLDIKIRKIRADLPHHI